MFGTVDTGKIKEVRSIIHFGRMKLIGWCSNWGYVQLLLTDESSTKDNNNNIMWQNKYTKHQGYHNFNVPRTFNVIQKSTDNAENQIM